MPYTFGSVLQNNSTRYSIVMIRRNSKEKSLGIKKFKKINAPVIYQPVKPDLIPDTSPDPDTSVFQESGVGLSDADKDKQEDDRIKSQSKTTGGGAADGDGDSDKDGKGKGGGDSSEDGFSIFKIFKIVPIGINVLAKAPTLASGFGDLVEGTAKGLINASLSTLDLFTTTFSFSLQGFKFMFILLICMVENLSNLNACILFYLIDMVILIVFLVLFSVLKLVDEVFMIRLTGVSVSELIMSLAGPIIAFDDFVHSISGYHLIRYPDYIIKRCYTCSVKLNTKRTKETASDVIQTLFGVIPRRADEPLAKISAAFTKFGSIFDL